MSQQVDAIYDSGVLRPLGPLAIPDQACVKITVDAHAARESAEQKTCEKEAENTSDGEGSGKAVADFEKELDALLFDGPTLPPGFSRAEIYSDHD